MNQVLHLHPIQVQPIVPEHQGAQVQPPELHRAPQHLLPQEQQAPQLALLRQVLRVEQQLLVQQQVVPPPEQAQVALRAAHLAQQLLQLLEQLPEDLLAVVHTMANHSIWGRKEGVTI